GLDVLAFCDEEGVRFPTTLVSSSAVAGRLSANVFQAADADGVTVADALERFGCDPALAPAAAYAPGDVLGYIEIHIEQGPVLEREGLPLGVVTSIAGQSRFRVEVGGEAGHAGTVPMAMRRDALAAAAEMILAVESVGAAGPKHELVATVGRIAAQPGAVNVIPARVSFTLDVRAATDPPRLSAVEAIRARFREIADRRHATLTVERYHETPTTPCAPWLQAGLAAGVEAVGAPVRRLTSGAGHDGHAIHALTDIGMLFVRCRGGISHNPNEYAEAADMGLAVQALVEAIVHIADRADQGDGA
ncbi:MAG TPA: hydantoinase/carbamoylase family amidase, partial [Methylomirabilota bacterium]|nr:hydantoinase/carbamoylase family amidase [Methylomirabilota bacterium]